MWKIFKIENHILKNYTMKFGFYNHSLLQQLDIYGF